MFPDCFGYRLVKQRTVCIINVGVIRKSCPGKILRDGKSYLIKASIASSSQANIPFECLAVFFQSEFLVRS